MTKTKTYEDKYQTFQNDDLFTCSALLKGVRRNYKGEFFCRIVRVPYETFIDSPDWARDIFFQRLSLDIQISLYSDENDRYWIPNGGTWVREAEEIPPVILDEIYAEVELVRQRMEEEQKKASEQLESPYYPLTSVTSYPTTSNRIATTISPTINTASINQELERYLQEQERIKREQTAHATQFQVAYYGK
jgi:hypothetical protein